MNKSFTKIIISILFISYPVKIFAMQTETAKRQEYVDKIIERVVKLSDDEHYVHYMAIHKTTPERIHWTAVNDKTTNTIECNVVYTGLTNASAELPSYFFEVIENKYYSDLNQTNK